MTKLLLLFILSFQFVFAQEMYYKKNVKKIYKFHKAEIILNSNDTINGFVKDQLYVGNKYVFKKNAKSKKSKISISDIKKITIFNYFKPKNGYSDKLVYERIQFDDSKNNSSYLRVLADGDVTLFRYKNHVGTFQNPTTGSFQNMSIDGHLIRTKEGLLSNLETNNSILSNKDELIKRLEQLLPCESLINKVKSGEIKKNQIQEIVHYYNLHCAK